MVLDVRNIAVLSQTPEKINQSQCANEHLTMPYNLTVANTGYNITPDLLFKMNISREFNPVSKNWQIETCNELGISFDERDVFYQPSSHLGDPSTCFKIRGDGNCLFRSIAFAVSGNEELQLYFRNIITSCIAKSRNPTVNNEIPEDYLKRKKMRENGVWGTDIELYFAAKVFNCSIFVYSKYGNSYDWLEFKTENKTTSLAIYLHHKNSDHYDVVTSVSNLSELSVKEKENQHSSVKEQFICIDNYDHHEKDDTQFEISMVSSKLYILNIIKRWFFLYINDEED